MALPVILTAPAVAGVIATITKFVVGYAIMRIIAAFGIGLVTFKALDLISGQIDSFIVSNTSGIGGQFWDVAVTLNAPHAIKVVSSAYIGAITIRAAMGVYNRVTFGNRRTA